MENEKDIYAIELSQTRPAMLSVPYVGELPIGIGALLFTLGCILYILLGWKFSIWVIFAWYVAGWAIARDYHALTKAQRWLYTSAWTSDADRQRHGGSSTTPTPIKSNRPKGIPSDAV